MNRRSVWAGLARALAVLCVAQVLALGCGSEVAGSVPLGSPWLGQRPPGEKPERFAPPIRSAYRYLGRLAFSRDGEECFFTVDDGRSGSAQGYRARRTPDPSLRVELVPGPVLSAGTYEGDPCVAPDGPTLSPDGRSLLFVRHDQRSWVRTGPIETLRPGGDR